MLYPDDMNSHGEWIPRLTHRPAAVLEHIDLKLLEMAGVFGEAKLLRPRADVRGSTSNGNPVPSDRGILYKSNMAIY